MALERHEIAFTERQLRFIEAIRRTGRGGIDRNDIVRRALDARIQKFIDDGAIAEKDGGELESDGKKNSTPEETPAKPKAKDERPQRERFIEFAREHGAEDDVLDRALGDIGRAAKKES